MPTKTKKTKKSKKTTKKPSKLKSRFNLKSILALAVILILTVLGIKILFISHADIVSINGTAVGIAGAAKDQSNGAEDGYWIAASDGGVFAEGSAPYYGSMGGKAITAPIVSITATPDRLGYYLLGADGAVYAFGDAQYVGGLNGGSSYGTISFSGNVIGLAAHTGGGYWIMTSNGGTYALGNAPSMGYNPSGYGGSMVSIDASSNGQGYYATSSSGQVYALPVGSGGCGNPAASNIITVVTNPGVPAGCWEIGSDGGVFSYNSNFYGSAVANHPIGGIIGAAATSDGAGYWLLGGDGGIFAYGDATYQGRVSVSAPVITSFTASPTGLNSGQGLTLSWSATNATNLSITGVGAVSPTTAGSVTIHPSVSSVTQQQYILSATNSGGSSTKTVVVGICPGGTNYNSTFGCINPATNKPVTSTATSGSSSSSSSAAGSSSGSGGTVTPTNGSCSNVPNSHLTAFGCACNTGYTNTGFYNCTPDAMGPALPSQYQFNSNGCMVGFDYVGGVGCVLIISKSTGNEQYAQSLGTTIKTVSGVNYIAVPPVQPGHCVTQNVCRN